MIISITSTTCLFFVVRTFKILPSSYFEVYNILLWTIVHCTIEYQSLFLFSNPNFVRIDQLLPTTHPPILPSLWKPLLCSLVSMRSTFVDSTYEWDYAEFVLLCLFISLNKISSRFICIVTHERFSFLWLNSILLFIYTTLFVSIHLLMDT